MLVFKLIHVDKRAAGVMTKQSTIQRIYVQFVLMSSNGNIFRVTGHLWGESTYHRWIPLTKPVTRSFHVFFDVCLNKRLNKQFICRWFWTPRRSFWRHCNILRNIHACSRFVVFCYVFSRVNLPISLRDTSLALGQLYDCPSASEATLKDMGR